MAILDDIISQLTGACFFRADLHIHSVDGSHDVEDATMTANAIVETAEREGLTFIAITDHNEVIGVESAIKASQHSPNMRYSRHRAFYIARPSTLLSANPRGIASVPRTTLHCRPRPSNVTLPTIDLRVPEHASATWWVWRTSPCGCSLWI